MEGGLFEGSYFERGAISRIYGIILSFILGRFPEVDIYGTVISTVTALLPNKQLPYPYSKSIVAVAAVAIVPICNHGSLIFCSSLNETLNQLRLQAGT